MRAQGGQTEDGRDAAATEEASSEDEVLRSAMYAGFSSEEASVFLQEKKNSQVSQVRFDAQLREDFWIDLGFPKGSRWWENSDSPIHGAPVNPNAVVRSDASLGVHESSESLQASLNALDLESRIGTHTDQNKRSFVNSSSIQDSGAHLKPSRRGVHIRPWRGPLPRPRRKEAISLAAFWPSSAQAFHGSCSPVSTSKVGWTMPQPPNLDVRSEFPPLIAAVSVDSRSGPAVIPAEIEAVGILNSVSLEINRAALVNRAKGYGLTRKLLRRPIPRTCRHFSSRLGLIPMSDNNRPSYAAMAARQPTREGQRPPMPQARGGGLAAPRGGRGSLPRSSRGRAILGGRDRGHARGSGRGWFNPGRGRGFGQVQAAAPQQRYVPVDLQEASQGTQAEAPEPIKAKKPRTPFCFRCKCLGHLQENCSAILDCCICNKKNNHVPAKCPILKMPRPTASMLGCAKNELTFFRIPEFDLMVEAPAPAPTALISVSGGKLDALAIQLELAKLSRVEWNWEALPHGDDSFLVVFPSEDELLRMADIEYKLKSGISISISQWERTGDASPAYYLDEIWVHVTGVPHDWRHFLAFWAVGSMIGTTIEVDMLTYRKKGIIRLLVGILDREQLPLTTDIVFHKVGYDITFTPELPDFEPAMPSLVLDASEKEDGDNKEDGAPRVSEFDPSRKKQKNVLGSFGPNSSSDRQDSAPMHVDCSEVHRPMYTTGSGVCVVAPTEKSVIKSSLPPGFKTGKPNGSISLMKPLSPSKERTTDHAKQVSVHVVPGSALGAGTGAAIPAGDLASDNWAPVVPQAGPSLTSMVNGTTMPLQFGSLNMANQTLAACSRTAVERNLVATQQMKTTQGVVQDQSLRGESEPENYAPAPVISYGNSPSHFHYIDGLRRSLRCNMQAANGSYLSDIDMTEKAMRRAAARNLDADLGSKTVASSQEMLHSPLTPVQQETGMSQHINSMSFVTMTDRDCAINLDNLGLTMKRSSSGTNLSIKALKRIEIDRTRLYQSNKREASKKISPNHMESNPFDLSDDEATEPDSDVLAHLIKDVSAVDLETEDLDTRICDLMASSRKSRKNRHNSNKDKKRSS